MRLPHLRPFDRDPLYLITACIAGRRELLANSTAHAILSAVWTRSAEIDGWFIGRYLLMLDHIHLFARPTRTAKPLAQWIKTWKSISSRELSRALNVPSPIWQPNYFDHFIRSSQSYSEKWDYVSANPVRKNLVSRPSDWPWQGEIHSVRF